MSYQATQSAQPARIGAAGTGDDPFGALPTWYPYLTAAGTAIGAYHGYKRDNSVGWAIGWGVLGSLFPFIVIPVAVAQGLGKRKGK